MAEFTDASMSSFACATKLQTTGSFIASRCFLSADLFEVGGVQITGLLMLQKFWGHAKYCSFAPGEGANADGKPKARTLSPP
eukprot:scaffold315147_cov19-Prasinocladus_malaysianus.AAC.1